MKKLYMPRFLHTFIVLLFTSICLPLWSSAQIVAATSGDWNTPSTWVGNTVPTINDAVSIPSGLTVTINGTAAALSIQVNNGSTASSTSTLTLANAATLTVTNEISLGTSNGSTGLLTMGTGGTITTGGFAVNSASTGSAFTPGTGTVVLTGNNTLPAIGFGTFNNLTIQGGTTHVSADLTINGTLTTNASTTLDLGTAQLLAVNTVTNNGTIETQNTSTTPLPASKNWSGSGSGVVLYNASSGGQSIVTGTYGNLYVNSGTSTAANTATGTIAVAGLISAQTATTVIDMGTNQLTATTNNVGIGGQTNAGTIRTAYVGGTLADPAIPIGRTWGGTIEYYAASGQKILAGTYNNLKVTANGIDFGSDNIVINGNFTSSASTIIDLASEQLTGTFDATGFLGTLRVQAESLPFPTGKTWGGTVQYNGTLTAQNIVSANYNNLIISNYRRFNVVFPANINVAGNLTLSAIVEDADFITTGSTVTLNGSTAQTITISSQKNITQGGLGVTVISSAPFAFNNVTLNGTGVKTLNSEMRIAGALTLTSGELASNSTANILILLDGSTSTAGSLSSYVSARVERFGSTAFIFPLGAGGVYAPLTITAPGAGGDVVAQYVRASAYTLSSLIASPLTRVSACEYWYLNQNAGTTVTATIKWSAQSGCNGGVYINDLTNLRVAGLFINTNTWTKIASTVNGGSTTTEGTITFDAAPDFDFITLATEGTTNPLPVKFLSVQATRQQGNVSITWTTATEVNVDRYEIERSEDGRNFGTIAQAAPQANNGTGASYQGRDLAAPVSTVYYRIKGVDFDGHLTYSNIVRLQSEAASPEFTIVPNPAIGRDVYLQTSGLTAGTYDAVIVDPIGRAVYRQRLTLESGSSSRRLALPGQLAAGLYHVRIEGMGQRATVSVVLQ